MNNMSKEYDEHGGVEIEDEDDSRVTLNIGGQLFETRRHTLQNAPGSMLSAMFGTSRIMAKPDDKGYYFFDRDHTHFRLLLNFLRTGKVILPESKCSLQELLLEAEYYCLEEVREAVQRALGGLKFEDDFVSFSAKGGVWAEGNIVTHCSIDNNNKDKKTKYEGLPQVMTIVEIEGKPALRIFSILPDMNRRAMCTSELFDADTQRAELLFKMMSNEETSSDPPPYFDKFVSGAGGVFEFFLWNPSSGEYIGIFLQTEAENRSLNIACYEGGHKKEKHVENAWDYEQEMRFTIQASGDKTEVRVTTKTSKKKFHVPLSMSRIAPFQVVIGQRAGVTPFGRSYSDVIIKRVAVSG